MPPTTPSRERPSFDLTGLLTIDVSAELRKLSEAQLSGPWQLPTELVRRAIRGKARRLDIVLARHRVRVTHDGQALPEAALRNIASLLDPRGPAGAKHEALTKLESEGDFALLALVGLKPTHLSIISEHAGARWVLQLGRDRKPRLTRTAGRGQDGTMFDMRSAELDRRKIEAHVRSACRFAPALLRINGRRLPVAQSPMLVRGPLRAPLRGEVRILCEGEKAQAWLLEHGVVTTSVTIPNAPAFEAAVEMGDDAHDHLPARVRERLEPELPTLRDQAVELIVQAAAQADAYPEALRVRLSQLVLAAKRHGLDHPALEQVPIFRTITEGRSSCCPLETIRSRVTGSEKQPALLTALYPHQRPEKFALGHGFVLVADETERSALADLLHVRFRPPDPHHGAPGPIAVSRRMLVDAKTMLRRTAVFIRHPRRHPPLPDHRLTAPEQRFLNDLRESLLHDASHSLPLRDVRLCEGAGPVRRTREGVLVLPRHNPLVRACIIACSRDKAWWLYPAVLALLDGRDIPPRALRRRWLERVVG